MFSNTTDETVYSSHKKQVYLFGTCLIDIFYPQAGLDAVSLLELSGYEVLYPQAQTCCGQPPYNSGFKSPALKIAKQTIQLFSAKEIPLIVPSASCAGMIKHHYPTLFKPHSLEAKQSKDLAERTFELIDFIADKLPYNQQPSRTPINITLHESCSALREMNIAHSWRHVLNQLDNINVTYPKNNQECCGFGGTFSVKSDAISAVMTQDKCHNLLNTTGKHILSGDCGCLMNIGEHLKFEGKNDPCLHLASFLVAHFGLNHAH
jgi:L-lactate dehydrogenase complex protein LldE